MRYVWDRKQRPPSSMMTQPALHPPLPQRLLAPTVRLGLLFKVACPQAERPTLWTLEARNRQNMRRVVRWLSMNRRKLGGKWRVSHSRLKRALSSIAAFRLTKGTLEVEVTEVDGRTQAEIVESSEGHAAREKELRKQERRAAHWRAQPSKAPLDSQESCLVS